MDLNQFKLLILASLILLFSCSDQTFTAKESDYVLSQLDKAKELAYLDSSEAYFIDPQGTRINYQAFKGKWLLLDFWSTGCIPCIKEFPLMAKFNEENTFGISVLAVSVDRKFERYQKSAEKYEIGVPHFFAGYTYKNQIFNLNVKTFQNSDEGLSFRTLTPQYVLIDPDGRIVDKSLPKPSNEAFSATLNDAITEYNLSK